MSPTDRETDLKAFALDVAGIDRFDWSGGLTDRQRAVLTSPIVVLVHRPQRIGRLADVCAPVRRLPAAPVCAGRWVAGSEPITPDARCATWRSVA